MNSLANLNSVVDDQGDSSTWPSDHGWDPPVATIGTGSLTDNRLPFHHPSAPSRQEWDWSDSQMILASQYAADEHELIDCKPGILQLEALGSAGAGGSSAGLRQYGAGILSAVSMSPSIGGSATQSSWPGALLNAVPIRQHMGLDSSSGSCYSSSSLMYGEGVGLGGGGGGGGGSGMSSYYNTHHSQLQLDMEQRRIHDILRRGVYSASGGGSSPDFTSGRIGLNLGGRTYFSAEDSTTLARFHVGGRRFRPNSPSLHVPLCQAEGCKADLSIAKHYHRRHKVCEYHSKAATVVINGNTQRFCQQCSRFHALTEFDEGKRSCRQRLADHNRRRRKPQPGPPLPAPTSATQATSSSTDHNPALNQNEDQDTLAGATAAHGATSQSDQQGGQQVLKEVTAAKAASTSSAEQTPSLLSSMTLAPPVSLTLQNGSREIQGSNLQVSSEDNNITEKEAAYETQTSQYLLNGPSLSLSSNIAAAVHGASVGAGDSVAPSSHQSPAHAQHAFNEVEFSVPWLRAHHAGSSSRMGLMQQESLGTLSTGSHQAEEGSMAYNSSGRKRNVNGQYMNEHGRLLAEHMQSLQSQAARSAAQEYHHHHQQQHHQTSKAENWMLENAVAQEGQIVLSLLETASNAGSSRKDHQYNAGNTHEEDTGGRHPLGFLQHPHAGLHLMNSGSPAGHMDHEASDAALSLHCMQALRPLNESGLYTTADFMKDGFV